MKDTRFQAPQDHRARRAIAAAIAAALALAGCGGGESTGALRLNTAAQPVDTPALFVFFDSDADGTGDSIARIDLESDTVTKTAVVGVSGSGGTHKQAFYKGPIWVGSGPLVWGIDPDTLQVVSRPAKPSIQGNREGTIGAASVDPKSTSLEWLQTLAAQVQSEQAEKAGLRKYFERTSLTYEEARVVDICAIRSSRSGINGKIDNALLLKAITAAEPFHNMGYSPVGIEPAPDGKLTMFAVRQGDHSFFLDTDPDSATFGMPVRFVYPRLGVVKDRNNAVVKTFAGAYTPAGGAAPGKLQYNRVSTGTSETDKNTYTEPCDSTSLRNAAGQIWSWWPDVNGDTITGANMSTINSANPQVIQVRVPIITRSSAPASAGGTGSAAFGTSRQRVGPWMASLLNRNVGNEFFFTVENEGDNSESVWDVTNPANVFEVQRIVTNLKNVLATDIGAAPLASGNTYAVRVSYVSTGGEARDVNYRYVSLPGDDMSGASADVTRAYLQKVTAADPGPNFILNGLNGRAGTSEANIARREGTGPDTILFSDEVWLLTGTGFGAIDGFQILNLTGLRAPYLITETIALPSAFSGSFSPTGKKFYQLRANKIDVIDVQSRKLVNVIGLPGSATGLAFASYKAAAGSPGGTTSGTPGGPTGPGGPCNPCGGCGP
jgi:hypothetical protein